MTPIARGTEPELSPAFSLWLDAFRWIAATLVVLTHINNRLLLRLSLLPAGQRTSFSYGTALLAGFGHQAVVVFFVISGFLVGGSLWRERTNAGDVALPRYFLKRLTRLWVVLLPALLLVLVCDRVGIDVLRAPQWGIYLDDLHPTVPDLAAPLSAATFACNALFLNNVACAHYGSDEALWSLFNELWYYVVFALLVTASIPRRRSWQRALGVATSVLLLTLFTRWQTGGASFAPYLAIWLVGVVCNVRRRPLVDVPLAAMAAILFAWLIGFRLAFRTDQLDAIPGAWFAGDAMLALLFGNLLLLLKARTNLAPPVGGGIHKTLADFSFTLYCVHTPILMLYASLLMYGFGIGWHMTPETPHVVALTAAALPVSMLAAWAFSLLTERNTARVRRWVMRRTGLD
jgi:peptidoglycan/LPS O-acetylase OafA/YrhL